MAYYLVELSCGQRWLWGKKPFVSTIECSSTLQPHWQYLPTRPLHLVQWRVHWIPCMFVIALFWMLCWENCWTHHVRSHSHWIFRRNLEETPGNHGYCHLLWDFPGHPCMELTVASGWSKNGEAGVVLRFGWFVRGWRVTRYADTYTVHTKMPRLAPSGSQL